MKKSRLLFTLSMLIGAALFTVSCQKSNTEDPEVPEVPQTCQHDSLVFVAGVQPTDSTCGSIEHYECPVCHAMFLDQECKEGIQDDVIWATSYVPLAGQVYADIDDICRTIDAEYKGMSGSSENFAFSAIGIWLFKKILEPKLSDMLKALFAFHDQKGQGKTFSPEVKAIVEQLSHIENQLKRIADYLQEKEISEKVDRRQSELQAFRNATEPCFDFVMEQIEGYTENDELPQERINDIKSVVDEWFQEGIKGSGRTTDVYDNICIMLDYINGTWSTQKTFPELYDHIAMRSTPWAREGNTLREAMRACDILSITEAYIMLSLYYKFHPEKIMNRMRYEYVKKKMTVYYNCMERFQVNPVEENVIRWWWKDKDGGSKLNQYALDKAVFHFDYVEDNLDKAIADRNKYDFSKEFAEALWLITEENIPVGSFLEFNDYKMIYKYIKDSEGSTGPQRTLYSGIQHLGFTGLKSFAEGGRIVYRSKDHQFCGPSGQEKSEGYADYLYFSARNHYDDENIFGLETSLDENAKKINRGNEWYRKKAFFSVYNPIPSVFRTQFLMKKGERTNISIQGISRSNTVSPYQPYITK